MGGARRVKDGHPAPYGLKYIEVDNERELTAGYNECVKKFARAAWRIDPDMSIMASFFPFGGKYNKGTEKYKLMADIVGWFVAQGKGDKFCLDIHYSGSRSFADKGKSFENGMGITLQRELAEDFPGFKLRLCPLEENGSRCDWERGLAHAHNWNTLQRHGDCFDMLGTANTFQPHGLHYMWDQGRIHYTADKLWFMPSACIDEMMMRTWKPNVVATASDSLPLDVTAKTNDDNTELTLYVANISDHAIAADLDILNFKLLLSAKS